MTDTVIYHNTDRVEPLYRGTQIVWYVFYVIETILLFRFLLKIIGANAGAGFTQFVYAISAPFVSPFLYVVGSPHVLGATIEWSTVIAMIVYWVVAWGIVRLITMGRPISATEAHEGLREQDV